MDKIIKIITWNLGNSRYPETFNYKKARRSINLHNIFSVTKKEAKTISLKQAQLLKEEKADIVLLQEVSKTIPSNHFINGFKLIRNNLNYNGCFYPTINILGMQTGKAVFTKKESISERIKYPIKNKKMFIANNNFIVTRIKLNNKNLVIINIHLIAFKENKILREEQLKYVFNFANREYKKGNYVIIGGDFNLDMPIMKPYNNYIKIGSSLPDFIINSDFILCYPEKPTLRGLRYPYGSKCSLLTIDGFIISKNIETVGIKTINSFKYSDHAPVILEIKISKN